MRRILQYHEWAACTWEARAAVQDEARPDYSEGARAYALRQADIRRSMKSFSAKAWQYVPAYVLLTTADGTDTVSSSHDAIVPPMNAAPTMNSTPALVLSSSDASLTSILAASSTASLPELESATSATVLQAHAHAPSYMSSSSSLPSLASTSSSSTTTLPGLASMSNSSVMSLSQDGRALEDTMDEMSQLLGMS